MKKIFTSFLIAAICLNNFQPLFAQVNVQDSLALVDLYNSTDGPHWIVNTNWLTENPVSEWYGISITNKRVTGINLVGNHLKGSIPSSIGNLAMLTDLELGTSPEFPYANFLNGSIPSSIGNLINLLVIDLSYNQLSGAIPSSIRNLKNLFYLFLEHNELRGSIPTSIVNIGYVDLSFNQLSGSIPSSVGSGLGYLDLSYNQLSGNIPSSLGNPVNINLTELNLSGNQLSGSIPSSLGNLTYLHDLNLSYNQLSGSIPSSLGKLVSLNYLKLNDNQLSGSIPASLGNLSSLYQLILNNNQLNSHIPSSLGKLLGLSFLYLNNNRLSGNIPFDFGNLTGLYDLLLNNNELSGSLPASFNNLTNLIFNMDVSNNRLSGTVPQLNKLASSVIINLSRNHFTFAGMQLIARTFPDAIYAPQANIPVHQNGNSLSVSAGGALSNNTYKWFKCEETSSVLVATIKGDSVFHPKENGKYRVKVLNSVATRLQLYSSLFDYKTPTNAVIASSINTLQQNDKPNLFRVYPNPAKDVLQVETNGSTTFSLINQSGKILITANINSKGSINVSGIAAGLYYLKNKITGSVKKVVIAR